MAYDVSASCGAHDAADMVHVADWNINDEAGMNVVDDAVRRIAYDAGACSGS